MAPVKGAFTFLLLAVLLQPPRASADPPPNFSDLKQEKVERYIRLATTAQLHGDYEQAVARYSAALLLDHDSAEANGLLASALIKLSQFKEARLHAQQAIDVEPKVPAWRSYYAQACSAMQEYKEAIRQFTVAIELGDDDSRNHLLRGQAYYYLEEYESALEDIKMAIRYSGKQSDLYRWRGRVLLKQSHCSDALRDFKRAIALDADDANNHTAISEFYSNCQDATLRDLHQAVVHAELAVRLSKGKYGVCFAVLASAQAESGDFTAAVESQSKALQLANANERADWESALQSYKAGRRRSVN